MSSFSGKQIESFFSHNKNFKSIFKTNKRWSNLKVNQRKQIKSIRASYDTCLCLTSIFQNQHLAHHLHFQLSIYFGLFSFLHFKILWIFIEVFLIRSELFRWWGYRKIILKYLFSLQKSQEGRNPWNLDKHPMNNNSESDLSYGAIIKINFRYELATWLRRLKLKAIKN